MSDAPLQAPHTRKDAKHIHKQAAYILHHLVWQLDVQEPPRQFRIVLAKGPQTKPAFQRMLQIELDVRSHVLAIDRGCDGATPNFTGRLVRGCVGWLRRVTCTVTTVTTITTMDHIALGSMNPWGP